MSKLNNWLAKIDWYTRKTNFRFELLKIHGGYDREWGFRMFTYSLNLYEHSLLAFFISLPNRTTRQRLTVTEWDVLWMSRRLWKRYDSLSDSILWGQRQPSYTESIELWILDRLFK